MPKNIKAIPDGFSTVTPYLVVDDSRKVIRFLQGAFGAEELHVMDGPDGKVVHAMVRVGTSLLMLSDASQFSQPTRANLFLYVTDVDAAFKRAVEAGAKEAAPVADMFWGDRWGMLADPFGNVWQIATHIEDLSPEQMAERAEAASPK
jgi:PhnB protein